MGFLIRALIAALGLWLATRWVSGITVDDAGTLVLAGLLLGVVNAIVRPIAILITFPITIVTLGFFLLVINAAMLAWSRLFARAARRGIPARRFWARSSSASPAGSARSS